MFLMLLASLLDSSAAENGTRVFGVRDERTRIFESFTGEEHLSQIPLEERTLLQFVLDFSIRFEWDQIVLFVPISSAWLKPFATIVFEFFNGHGKYISIHSTLESLLPYSLHHNKHRVGVALFWSPDMDDFFAELSEMEVFHEYQSWLFIRREAYKGMNMAGNLTDLKLGLESSAVICRVERHAIPTKPTRKPTTTQRPDDSRFYEREDACTPDNMGEEWYKEFCATEDIVRSKREVTVDPQLLVVLNEVYKVTGSREGPLVENYLGFWDDANRLSNCDEPTPVEKRLFLHPFSVVIGVRNSTFEKNTVSTTDASLEKDEDEAVHMKEVLDCLLYGLNVSRNIVQYPKLGWRNEEGGWTHMLGAVVEGEVDFALDTISVTMDVLQEMSLTHPILKTMNNVYFKRPDSGGMRNIFLDPFSPYLLVSVFSTAVLLGIAMITIALVNCRIIREDAVVGEVKREIKVDSDERKWEVSEAALWSVSVMCMQGSPWRPSSKSGSLLLICGLLFALVIYNAYAAFITSVLSVKIAKIKDLEDLINSDFAFGYTLGSPDELFLRTVNDSLLRELYFMGLRKNDGVKDSVMGMHKAGKGGYAFFVAARFGRRALRRDVAYSQRCDIQELILPITRTVAAIPMSKKSSIKKLLNFRILRMAESGLLHRFQKQIFPPMPKCVERNTFNSARLADVYSAFTIIVIGWILAWMVLFGEILWHKKKTGHGHAKKEHSHHFHFKDNPIVKSIRAHDFHWPRMHN
ncbi:UNVERIFIED_CONTAM: hypothetical protein PYX00_002832 [Menopon gallinae]|uniref:Ionotropic glutamate receptor C-terminal domain-containing protein n=1 Tax=Menopon gallinae TaxID=328185 RepID=A0AAW2HY51_9NEOP